MAKKTTPAFSVEKKRWTRETLRPSLKKLPERLASFTTVSALSIDEPLYTPADVDNRFRKNLGFPESFPLLVAFILPCTGANSGPCANFLDMARQRRRTGGSNTSSKRARPA